MWTGSYRDILIPEQFRTGIVWTRSNSSELLQCVNITCPVSTPSLTWRDSLKISFIFLIQWQINLTRPCEMSGAVCILFFCARIRNSNWGSFFFPVSNRLGLLTATLFPKYLSSPAWKGELRPNVFTWEWFLTPSYERSGTGSCFEVKSLKVGNSCDWSQTKNLKFFVISHARYETLNLLPYLTLSTSYFIFISLSCFEGGFHKGLLSLYILVSSPEFIEY